MSQQLKPDLSRQKEIEHKNMVAEFFKLISAQKFKEGLRFFAPNCKTHNPYISGNMDTLTDAMIAANKEGTSKYPEAEFTVNDILADGDFVAGYTQLLNVKSRPEEGGLRQVHLFRFEDNKIVEYWDVTQQILPNMPNAKEAF
ncbi:MAG TPA: nuclear transport factor 2 family protein [Candidatus Sulfotelmatobacter sp.]|jgi:predicted SnoaL-like aldol condensation-catalyzing enzyme|nr:nuclear transport factor 2 family protein [Candidatus Sulfotelmatobacter sp.]